MDVVLEKEKEYSRSKETKDMDKKYFALKRSLYIILHLIGPGYCEKNQKLKPFYRQYFLLKGNVKGDDGDEEVADAERDDGGDRGEE